MFQSLLNFLSSSTGVEPVIGCDQVQPGYHAQLGKCEPCRPGCNLVYNAQLGKCEPCCYRCFMQDWNTLVAAYAESEQ